MTTIALAALSLWLAGRCALRREGRGTPGILGTMAAPFGRLVRLPAGTELLAGKRYRFGPGSLHADARVWIGWWNCRSFAADPTRHYFFDRGSRYAIRVDAVPPETEVTMQTVLSGALAGLGLLGCGAAAVLRRRADTLRRTGRRPDPATKRRAPSLLLSGLALLALGLLGLLAR